MGVQYRDTVKGIAKLGGYTVPHEIQRNLSLHSKELLNLNRAFSRLLFLDTKKILVVNFHETKARYGRLVRITWNRTSPILWLTIYGRLLMA